MSTRLETRYLDGFVRDHEWDGIQTQVTAAHELLTSGKGQGHDFLGWMDLPVRYDKEEFARIEAAAARIRQDTDIFIAIGIGGSYLGARAAIEFLKSPYYNAKKKDTPDVYFAGNSISSAALNDLLAAVRRTAGVHQRHLQIRYYHRTRHRLSGYSGNIWKSPSVPEEAKKRIYVTTDRAKGTLKGTGRPGRI